MRQTKEAVTAAATADAFARKSHPVLTNIVAYIPSSLHQKRTHPSIAVDEIISPCCRRSISMHPDCIYKCIGVSQIIKQFHILVVFLEHNIVVVPCRFHGPSHYIRIHAHVHHFVRLGTRRRRKKKLVDEPGVNAMQ